MSFNVKGDMDVLKSGTSEDRFLVSSIDGTETGEDGIIELDVYTESEVQERMGVIPLSRYGSTNYLPAGVAGSFEGSTSSVEFRMRSLLLEDNGDLVMLRNGTNGSTRNIYYSYMTGALTTSDMNSFVSTNKVYNPAYFANLYTGLYTINSDHNVVFGVIEKKSDKQQSYFLSVTNNTLNDALHTGVILPMNTFSNQTIRFVMMGNSEIFIFTCSMVNNILKLYVYTIPIQDVVNQVANPVFTKLTGWTTHSFYGDTFLGDQDGVVITNSIISPNIDDKPYMLYPQSAVSAFAISSVPDMFAAQDETTGMIRIKFVFDSWCSSYSSSVRPHSKFNFILNPTARIAKLDSDNVTVPLVVTDNNGTYTISGWAVTNEQIYTYYVNTYLSHYILPDGTSFMVQTGNTASESTIINRLSMPSSTSVFDALKDVNNYTITGRGTVSQPFASAIGSGLVGLELLPSNNCRMVSHDAFNNVKNVRSEYIPPANYTYKSIAFGSLQGFAPSTDRIDISNGLNNKCFISSINQSNVVSTNGGILTESRLSTPLNIDKNTNPIGTSVISIESNLLISFRDSQLGSFTDRDPSVQPKIALYVPQQLNIPVFAIIQVMQTNREAAVKVMEVNVNTRVGAITSLTLARPVYQANSGFIGAITFMTSEFPRNAVGLTIYEGSDFYFIGGMFPYLTGVVGNSTGWLFTAKVMKSSSQIETFRNYGRWYPYTVSVNYPFAVPGYGFGFLNGGMQGSDVYTRFIFTPCGTTSADYDAWVPKSINESLIVVSQDVKEGFIIYFTEETPVILSGKTFKLPISTIDLKTIKTNPANTTFHVYVVMDEGLVKYKITEEVISESGTSAYNTFWIGTIKTNNIQIESVDVKKRARLDIFGTSFSPAGSSFPVSYGLPSQPGTINW